VALRLCWCQGEWDCACACARVALLIQHAKCMRDIMSSFVASLAPPYSSTLSRKRHDFWNNVTDHKMCVLSFTMTFV
jgi:hypothetical protein